MIQYGRILHAVKNGEDLALQTSNLQGLINKANENKLLALLNPQITYLPDDLAIACTSVIPEYEEQNGRMTQKIDTIVAKFSHNVLTKLLMKGEIEALLQRANQRYAVIQKILKYQTSNSIDIKTTNSLPIPDISLED